jgi:hypothetical protein
VARPRTLGRGEAFGTAALLGEGGVHGEALVAVDTVRARMCMCMGMGMGMRMRMRMCTCMCPRPTRAHKDVHTQARAQNTHNTHTAHQPPLCCLDPPPSPPAGALSRARPTLRPQLGLPPGAPPTTHPHPCAQRAQRLAPEPCRDPAQCATHGDAARPRRVGTRAARRARGVGRGLCAQDDLQARGAAARHARCRHEGATARAHVRPPQRGRALYLLPGLGQRAPALRAPARRRAGRAAAAHRPTRSGGGPLLRGMRAECPRGRARRGGGALAPPPPPP